MYSRGILGDLFRVTGYIRDEFKGVGGGILGCIQALGGRGGIPTGRVVIPTRIE